MHGNKYPIEINCWAIHLRYFKHEAELDPFSDDLLLVKIWLMMYFSVIGNTVLISFRVVWYCLIYPYHDFISLAWHDDVIKWKHFSCYWPFVRGTRRSLVNSAHKGQWRGALMFPLICAWLSSWVNNGEAGDLRRHRAHYDVIAMGAIIRQPWCLWYNLVKYGKQIGIV